jgi:hypothetical protein
MKDQILFPMGTLAFLTFLVLLFIPLRRFRVAFAGWRGADNSKSSEPEAPDVSLANRNYTNLLELPLLFYVVCLMFYTTDRVEESALLLAWLYVGLRALHSAIHITYNNVNHRITVFALSNFALIWLWVLFFVKGS